MGNRELQTIVFSDVDGTLLTSTHSISPLTKQAIEDLERNGIPFVIVTARSITASYPMLDQYGIRCPVVAYCGGAILDEDRRIIYHRGFPRHVAQDIVEYVEREGFDATWCVYSFEDWVVKDRTDPRIQNEERVVMAESREGTVASIEQNEIQKVMCICNSAQTQMICDRLREQFPKLSIVMSSAVLIEIMLGGITKASAIHTLCDLWHVDPAQAIAFGDNYNDVPMLEAVGKGYLMGNAPEPLFERFSLHTTDNDHDGIYHALRELELI